MRLRRTWPAALGALGVLLLAPGAAQAVDCGLPGTTDPTMTNTALDVTGTIDETYNGDYVQIPFTVPQNTRAIRVRYSYDQPDPANPGQSLCGSGPNTLDMGVYSPRQQGETYWTSADSRGWSGSAVKDLAISEDGFTDDATYNTSRKAYVSGYTTRAYRPGPVPQGQWAVELGMGWVDPTDTDGVQYHVQVQTSTDASWSAHPPPANAAYDPTRVANPNRGWYAGDLHVHGEMEPGNATRTQTFAEAFGAAPAGGGLDFVAQVDHNNNITEDDLKQYQDDYPTKLIIPGVEETTYRGHFMNTGSSTLADFRTTPIYSIPTPNVDPNLAASATPVRAAVPPSQDFAAIQDAGGYTEVNHPTIFQTAPSACRGCAWNYTDTETDFSKVNAIEIQNGPPQIGNAFNPFTPSAIQYYEHGLDSGAHIAAVGGSDDHQGGGGSGATYAPVGIPATMVHAAKLSRAAVIDAIKGAHTYVKLYGVSSPDIELTAKVPDGAKGEIGDTVTGPSAKLTAKVTGATAAATGRTGNFGLAELKNGAVTKVLPIGGGSFTKTFNTSGSGRYSIEVTRTDATRNYVEDYSSPIWFAKSSFSFEKPKLNIKKGTGTVVVKVPGPGKLTMSGKGTKKSKATAKEAGKVSLPVKLTGDSERKLAKKGKLKLKLSVTYTPAGGTAYSKTTSLTLKRK